MSDSPPPAVPAPRANRPVVADMPAFLRAIRERTPARILVGRAGPSYLTRTQLELRRDHAAALDAVHAELDLARDFGAEFVLRFGLFEVASQAAGKMQYLMRPDLGRRLSNAAFVEIEKNCPV